jgi:hypothetical protein
MDKCDPAAGCPGPCAGARPDLAGWAPCRRARDPGPAGDALVPARIGVAPSLALGYIALGRLLVETRKIRLIASGACMYPNLRPGDRLDVCPKPVASIGIGEVVVVRRDGRFVGHRVVGKGENGQGPYVVTRPDRAESGDDGPCFEEDLLGVVSRIERAGQTLSPARPVHGTLAKVAYVLGATVFDARQAAEEKALRLLVRVQGTGAYRRAIRSRRASLTGKLGREVQVPLNSRPGSPLFRVFGGREGIERFFQEAGEANGGSPEAWSLAATDGRRAAASLSFYRRPRGCPHEGLWLAGGRLRIRYRGTGLAGTLFREAEEIAARLGGPLPRVSLPPGSAESDLWRREIGPAADGGEETG